MINEFIEALKNDTCYDFIANNYYKMSKEELKNCFLEVLFEVKYSKDINDDFSIDRVIEELKERYEE